MIVVKDLEKLKNYGFVRVSDENVDGYVWRYFTDRKARNGEQYYSMCVKEKGYKAKELINMTYSYTTIKITSQMYKDDVIEFIDINTIEKRIERKREKIKKLEKEIEVMKHGNKTE